MKGLSRLLAIFLFPLVLPVLGAPRRNIVFVIADDHGPDAGCYGNQVIKTPNLDRLASEGVRFTNAYCTTASCSASRSGTPERAPQPSQRTIRPSARLPQLPHQDDRSVSTGLIG